MTTEKSEQDRSSGLKTIIKIAGSQNKASRLIGISQRQIGRYLRNPEIIPDNLVNCIQKIVDDHIKQDTSTDDVAVMDVLLGNEQSLKFVVKASVFGPSIQLITEDGLIVVIPKNTDFTIINVPSCSNEAEEARNLNGKISSLLMLSRMMGLSILC